jgi:hypothetical protein
MNGACGAHGAKPNGKPAFDYTCDDCMLPWNHIEYDETPEYIEYHDNINHKKRIDASENNAQTYGRLRKG